MLHLWLYCLCRIWNYQSEIDWQYHFRVESADQNSRVFVMSKKYRLLRCSLLSKLDIWKRIVELVRTCSLWLLHILLLDIFHLNTRCRHTRVHLKFTFEVRMCIYIYIYVYIVYIYNQSFVVWSGNDIKFCKSHYDMLFSYINCSSILMKVFGYTILNVQFFLKLKTSVIYLIFAIEIA